MKKMCFICSLNNDWFYSACTLPVHCLYTACTLPVPPGVRKAYRHRSATTKSVPNQIFIVSHSKKNFLNYLIS